MGSFQPFEKSSERNRRRKRLGKIDAPLGEKLQAVKWGEYRLDDLFDHIEQGRRLKKEDQKPGNIPFVMAGTTNNGVVGYISNPVASFPANSITVDIFGNTFYRDYSFGAGDDTGVYWNTSRQYTESQMLFLASMIKRYLQGKYDFGHKLRSSKSYDFKISLPTTLNNEIDFDFMESFIRELEEERIRELQSYLAVTGLSDYTLTLSEQDALKGFETLEWREFNVTDVFNVKNTHNILSSEIAENSGGVPYLCASAENNGVSSYISYNADFLEDGNCIFIGGKTLVVSYQKDDFFSNDSHNLALYLKDFEADKSNQLYLATCIRKSLAHKYSWGNSISNAKIKGDKVMLPVRDGAPDYAAMQDFISAVQKLVIKDVVKYAEDKINATKKVVKNKDEYKPNEDKSFLSVAESADYKGIPR